MHDPYTVAFEIRSPIRRPMRGFPDGYRECWVTIWHRDRRGVDGACGWSHPRLTPAELADARRLIEDPHDNIRHWFPGCTTEDAVWRVARIYVIHKRLGRRWWQHPRWHIHHWRITIHPLVDFRRWAWSRCAGCGGRFTWGYAPTTNQWHSKGPQWFRGDTDVWHSECRGSGPVPGR